MPKQNQSDEGLRIGTGWGGVGPHGRGGDPWESKGIQWEGTHGRGTIGNPRDSMGGVPDEGNHWEPKGSHVGGALGPSCCEPIN